MTENGFLSIAARECDVVISWCVYFSPLNKPAGCQCGNMGLRLGGRGGVLFSPRGLAHLLFVELAEDQHQLQPRLSFCTAVVFVVERLKSSLGTLTCLNSEENFRSEIRHTFEFFYYYQPQEVPRGQEHLGPLRPCEYL